LINLLVAICAFYVLPKKFFYDATLIAYDKENEIDFKLSANHSFFKLTYLKVFAAIIGLIQYPILNLFFLYKITIPSNFHIITIKFWFYLGFFMIAVFMSMPSRGLSLIYIYRYLYLFIF
jgi:hypothetical protein